MRRENETKESHCRHLIQHHGKSIVHTQNEKRLNKSVMQSCVHQTDQKKGSLDGNALKLSTKERNQWVVVNEW